MKARRGNAPHIMLGKRNMTRKPNPSTSRWNEKRNATGETPHITLE